MLYPNGQRVFAYLGRHMSGALAAAGTMNYGGIGGARHNKFVSEVYSKTTGAIPSGYGQKAYMMTVKAGGIAGFSGIQLTPTGSGLLGFPIQGSTSITFSIADAEGQLISSGTGTASLSIALNNALLTASLNGSGEASFTVTLNTPTLGAEAGLVGSSSFVITGSLQPYAVGRMLGTTEDNTVLTVDAITAALISAAIATPLHANIKKVNDVTVTGTGATGNEWGP